MTLNEVQNQIIDQFDLFDDWMDKYSLIIEEGNELSKLEEKYKTPENLIQGCQSKVWLYAEYKDGKVHYLAESDTVIIRGIIALLIKVLSNRTPDEIINADLYFIEKIGLREHLSPTRSNGLTAMIKQMKFYAMAFKVKHS